MANIRHGVPPSAHNISAHGETPSTPAYALDALRQWRPVDKRGALAAALRIPRAGPCAPEGAADAVDWRFAGIPPHSER